MATRVYLCHPTHGHREGVEAALRLLSDHEDLTGLFHGEQVLVKPNCVSATRQLAATHALALEAVLEFVVGYNPKRIILGEGSAEDTLRAFRNFGYLQLARRYGAEVLDLNRDQAVSLTIYDREGRPRRVPVARTALESVRVSVALPKTHDTVIVTATVKNLAVGAIRRPHKWDIHQGYPAINVNIALLSRRLFPHLAVIDGFVGMEGDGPVSGAPVRHRVALAGTDPLAVDAVCAQLMGFAPRKIGYLVHAARMGLGEIELAQIEVVGSALEEARRSYRPHRGYEEQLVWQAPPELAARLWIREAPGFPPAGAGGAPS
ncbi:DUF362 domain-containing protein [Candidatus Bipolaricaulota bacterium]|nr:DUF362 domain-containing protein [Candidatus Bipolaricaulota bacterium]